MDIHIGKPIANTQIYIVDKYMKIVPSELRASFALQGTELAQDI